MTRPSESITEKAAYQLGLKHGLKPGHAFAPDPDYNRKERQAYDKGFVAGVDSLIDQQEVA